MVVGKTSLFLRSRPVDEKRLFFSSSSSNFCIWLHTERSLGFEKYFNILDLRKSHWQVYMSLHLYILRTLESYNQIDKYVFAKTNIFSIIAHFIVWYNSRWKNQKQIYENVRSAVEDIFSESVKCWTSRKNIMNYTWICISLCLERFLENVKTLLHLKKSIW